MSTVVQINFLPSKKNAQGDEITMPIDYFWRNNTANLAQNLHISPDGGSKFEHRFWLLLYQVSQNGDGHYKKK